MVGDEGKPLRPAQRQHPGARHPGFRVGIGVSGADIGKSGPDADMDGVEAVPGIEHVPDAASSADDGYGKREHGQEDVFQHGPPERRMGWG